MWIEEFPRVINITNNRALDWIDFNIYETATIKCFSNFFKLKISVKYFSSGTGFNSEY